jgi:hypothetical protein
MQRDYLHAQVWTTPVAACHRRLTFVGLLCREPGKRLKEDVPDLVVEFEASQERKKKMSRTRAGEGVWTPSRGARWARSKHALSNTCMAHGCGLMEMCRIQADGTWLVWSVLLTGCVVGARQDFRRQGHTTIQWFYRSRQVMVQQSFFTRQRRRRRSWR